MWSAVRLRTQWCSYEISESILSAGLLLFCRYPVAHKPIVNVRGKHFLLENNKFCQKNIRILQVLTIDTRSPRYCVFDEIDQRVRSVWDLEGRREIDIENWYCLVIDINSSHLLRKQELFIFLRKSLKSILSTLVNFQKKNLENKRRMWNILYVNDIVAYIPSVILGSIFTSTFSVPTNVFVWRRWRFIDTNDLDLIKINRMLKTKSVKSLKRYENQFSNRKSLSVEKKMT